MSVLISPSVFLIFIWFPLTELGEVFSGFWRLEAWWGGCPRETCKDWLADLVATEQNNWVTPNRPTRVKRNTVTALVLKLQRKRLRLCQKVFSWGYLDCRDLWTVKLCSSRVKKKFLKAVSLCQFLCKQVAMYFTSRYTKSYKAWIGSQVRGSSQRHLIESFWKPKMWNSSLDIGFLYSACVPAFIHSSFHVKFTDKFVIWGNLQLLVC